MSCNNSFYDYISNCTTAIRVNALLTPATPYQWVITDKFTNEYSGEAITNADGFFDIEISALPDGFFTPFAGEYKLEVFEDNCRKVDFKIAKFYDEIIFSVSAGTREKDNLGCDFTCTTSGGGPGNSAVFPFTDAATISIAWTEFLRGLYGGTPDVDVYQEVSSGVYQQVNVAVTMVGGPYDLSEIDVDNGGPATGYILVS